QSGVSKRKGVRRSVSVRRHYRFRGWFDQLGRARIGPPSILRTTGPLLTLSKLHQKSLLERIQWLVLWNGVYLALSYFDRFIKLTFVNRLFQARGDHPIVQRRVRYLRNLTKRFFEPTRALQDLRLGAVQGWVRSDLHRAIDRRKRVVEAP